MPIDREGGLVKEPRIKTEARAQWSRTSRIKVAILVCKVNWGHRDEDVELKNADSNLSG